MSNQRVLIVDDDRFNLNVMVEALRDICRPIVAKNGESAIRLAQTQSPELILLDVILPDLDGIEVCRRLKTSAETASIPIMLVTSLSDPADIERGLLAGAVDIVRKPLLPMLLRARVSIYLEWAHLRKPVASEGCDLL